MIDKSVIIKNARKTLELEGQAILDMIPSVDDEFFEVLEIILNSKGRVVVTGIGKSALVGQKIVGTFNSTGTPALFMHAADAIHGDLGMVMKEDVVICISKSGESPEIRALLPFVKKMKNPVIGLVANRDSFLGTHADKCLITPMKAEADPNNLAPTTSTTLQMAMGDALATALIEAKGFSINDFARNHPGGNLGKKLFLTLDDLRKKNGQPAVFPEASLQEVILEMTSKRLGVTAVVNPNNQVIGIITDGDLRRMLSRNLDFKSIRAKDIMTASPITSSPEKLASDAIEEFTKKAISHLIVSDKEYLGIVHIHDLVKEGLINR